MAAASSEESREKCSVTGLAGFLSELNLDFCAEDYSKYIKVDVSSEVKNYDSIIEDMLVCLDEFCQTADMIRNESGMCLSDLLPRINEQSKDLPAIFEKIDQLEAFVAIVRKSVDEMELKVNTAEKKLSTSKVKGFLSSLPIKRFRQKKETKPPDVEWTPISSPDLKQYFSKETKKTTMNMGDSNVEKQANENIT